MCENPVTPTVISLPRHWRHIARVIEREAELSKDKADAYRNAADELTVALPTWGDFRRTLEAEAGYLDSEALDSITDLVMNTLGDVSGVRVGAS